MGQTALLLLRRKARWGFFFRPEKSNGFGRVWTRELGCQRRIRVVLLRTTYPCDSSDLLHLRGSRCSIGGVATCCGLDGLRFEPRAMGTRTFFSTPVQTCSGAHPGGFLAADRSVSGIYLSLLSSEEVENGYSTLPLPSCAYVPCYGETLAWHIWSNNVHIYIYI